MGCISIELNSAPLSLVLLRPEGSLEESPEESPEGVGPASASMDARGLLSVELISVESRPCMVEVAFVLLPMLEGQREGWRVTVMEV